MRTLVIVPDGAVGGSVDGGSVGGSVGVEESTVTVTLFCAEPPVPVQVSVNVEVDENGPAICVPLRLLLPVQLPEALHAVALLLDHVSVEVLCAGMVIGLADRVSVGALAPPPLAVWSETVTLFCTLPPLPVQASV
jgi:hypothetical protein